MTREQLIAQLTDHFGLGDADLADDAPLFSSGLLDSFSLVDLISFLETEVGIRIGALEVTLENLDSVDRILAFVDRKTSAC